MVFLFRYKLLSLLAILFLIQSCSKFNRKPLQLEPPFLLNSIDLEHKKEDGSKDWDLISPDATYSLNSGFLRAKNPEIIIYDNNIPFYSINAKTSTILEDGKFVILEGQIKLVKLVGSELEIIGNSLTWDTKSQIINLKYNPIIYDNTTLVKTHGIKLNQSTHRLDFTGPTRIKSWKDKRINSLDPSLQLTAMDGSWNLHTGLFNADGPVHAKSIVKSSGFVQKLTATGLTGNSNNNIVSFFTCKINNPNEKLTSDKCKWDMENNILETLGNSEYIVDLSKNNRIFHDKPVNNRLNSKDKSVVD